MALSQEAEELDVGGEGTWDNVEPEHPGVVRTHPSQLPDNLDEEQVATPAEQDARQNI